jgi:hypothetical protein
MGLVEQYLFSSVVCFKDQKIILWIDREFQVVYEK